MVVQEIGNKKEGQHSHPLDVHCTSDFLLLVLVFFLQKTHIRSEFFTSDQAKTIRGKSSLFPLTLANQIGERGIEEKTRREPAAEKFQQGC